MKKFKLPAKADLKGRTSTISNAFAIAITPYLMPTERDIKNFWDALEIREGQCAYCLGEGNAMDHLKPLVTNGLPTGYITEIKNLVPCCSACNSAKGAKDFKDWYLSDNNLHRLYAKGLSNDIIRKRYDIIEKYIKDIPAPLNYSEILGDELWSEFLRRSQKMIDLLREDQAFCDKLSAIISKDIAEKK